MWWVSEHSARTPVAHSPHCLDVTHLEEQDSGGSNTPEQDDLLEVSQLACLETDPHLYPRAVGSGVCLCHSSFPTCKMGFFIATLLAPFFFCFGASLTQRCSGLAPVSALKNYSLQYLGTRWDAVY